MPGFQHSKKAGASRHKLHLPQVWPAVSDGKTHNYAIRYAIRNTTLSAYYVRIPNRFLIRSLYGNARLEAR